MPVEIELRLDDLTALRFATSPLYETVSTLQLLGRGRRPPALLAWLRQARRAATDSGLTLPATWPLLLTGRSSYPEFLVPAPHRLSPTIDEELAAMRRTTAAQMSGSLHRVFGADLPPAAAALVDDPTAGLCRIAGELRAAHELLIAPWWPRLRPVLAADIAYRTGRLAAGGIAAMLSDLHRDVRWQGDRVVVTGGRSGIRMAARQGIVLVPTATLADHVQLKMTSSTQTALRYPTRGIGNLFGHPAPPHDALVRLVGRPRATLLAALSSPAGTSALAKALAVTPSAVAQHLRVLRGAGLVETSRTGRTASHRLTSLGRSLVVG